MKRISKYYPVVLAILNLLLAQGTRFLAAAMRSTYDGVYEPNQKAFAHLTMWAIQGHWWPYIAATVCVVVVISAFIRDLSETAILRALVILLLLEVSVLFMTVVAFVLPFISFP